MYQPLSRVDGGHHRFTAVIYGSARYINIGALVAECHLLVSSAIEYHLIYENKLPMLP